jgi:hypothetical protein
MAILERGALVHLGVRRNGAILPLCGKWRSTWNWSADPREVTCPPCRSLKTDADRPPERLAAPAP